MTPWKTDQLRRSEFVDWLIGIADTQIQETEGGTVCLYMAAPIDEGEGEEQPHHGDPEQVPCPALRGKE